MLMRMGGGSGESSYRFVLFRRHSNVCIIQRPAGTVEDKYVMLKLANPGRNRGWLCHCGGVDVSVHPGTHLQPGEAGNLESRLNSLCTFTSLGLALHDFW